MGLRDQGCRYGFLRLGFKVLGLRFWVLRLRNISPDQFQHDLSLSGRLHEAQTLNSKAEPIIFIFHCLP